MAAKVARELLRRNLEVPPKRIGDVMLAATAQVGDQGITPAATRLLAGLPHISRASQSTGCATARYRDHAGPGEIAFGASDVGSWAGRAHGPPPGATTSINPRFVSER